MGDNNRSVRSAELRLTSQELALAAREAFGDDHCPCCRRRFAKSKRRPGRQDALSPTVAHNIALSVGGNEDVWIFTCNQCNQDQGGLSFADWAATLWRLNEPEKAGNAKIVADFIADWCAKHGVSVYSDPSRTNNGGPSSREMKHARNL